MVKAAPIPTNPPHGGTNTEANQAGAPTRVYSQVRHQGIGEYSNLKVTTTPSQLGAPSTRYPVFYVEADSGNTDFILFGSEGGQRHRLNAGDVWPLLDCGPADVWVVANSGTQKAHGLGTGDPEA